MSKRIKYILIGVAAVLVLLVVAPFFIPTSAYLGPLQDKASAALGAKVVVGDLRVALVPLPHLTASKIDVGEGAISVESVTIYPQLSTLFSATRKISSINADKLKVTKKGMDLIGGLAAGPEEAGAKGGEKATPRKGRREAKKEPKAAPAEAAPAPAPAGPPPVEVGKLRLRDAEIELASGKLPPLDLDVELEGLTLVHAELSMDGGKAKLKVEPKGEGWEIALNADNWQLPVGLPLKFDSLKANGTATKTGMSLPDISVKMYGGEAKANVELGWEKAWNLKGHANVAHLDIGPALSAMKIKPTLTGRLDADGPFGAQAAKPAELADVLNADFGFTVRDGILHGFDLASAATNLLMRGSSGGTTRFDQLTGHALVAGHGYKLRNVVVVSGILSAKANVDISPSKALGGRVDVDLKRSAGVINVPLAVSGTLSEPMLLPTKGALAGAVAGSVLLPGVGTAAGASVGDRIGKFFGGK